MKVPESRRSFLKKPRVETGALGMASCPSPGLVHLGGEGVCEGTLGTRDRTWKFSPQSESRSSGTATSQQHTTCCCPTEAKGHLSPQRGAQGGGNAANPSDRGVCALCHKVPTSPGTSSSALKSSIFSNQPFLSNSHTGRSCILLPPTPRTPTSTS